jgi:tripartite ATP-independent transporter DctP family solute receptor
MSKFTVTRIALAATLAVTAVAANAQAFPERNFRASLSLGKDHSLGIALSKFAACAAQKTGGKMKITPYFDSQLGGDGPAIQQLRSGTLEAAVIATASTTAILPAAGVFDLPFLIQNEKEADQLLDGKAGETLTAKFPSIGLVNLSYWEYGYRQTTNSRRPITKAEDFAGVKMRVMPSAVMVDAFKNIGAISLTMPLTELYTAMETKAVDGQENPFSTVELNKFYEVQKYLSLTKHMYNPAMIVWSKQLFDKLTPEEQNVLKQCGADSRDEQRRVNRQQNVDSLERLKKHGMAVNDVPAAEIAKMRAKVQPLYDKQTAAIGPEMMELVTGELKRIRGN